MAPHPPASIYFFKIILKSNLESIKIPKKFTGRHGSGLSNPVFLKPPVGKQWKVYHQTKQDNEVWFQEGWKEFVRFYSLDEGHLVLFKYEGTSRFDVHLFNKSALEIDYPSSSKNNLSDDTIKISDEMTPNQKVRQKTPLLSSWPSKKMRTTPNSHVGLENNYDQCQGTEFQKPTNIAELKFHKKEPEEEGTGARIFTKSTFLNSEHRRKRELTTVEKIRAKNRKRTLNLAEDLKVKKEQISSMQQSPLEKASSFKSEKHQFKVKMTHAYICGRSNLHVPTHFARTHLHDCPERIKLVVQDVAWPVEYVFRITP